MSCSRVKIHSICGSTSVSDVLYILDKRRNDLGPFIKRKRHAMMQVLLQIGLLCATRAVHGFFVFMGLYLLPWRATIANDIVFIDGEARQLWQYKSKRPALRERPSAVESSSHALKCRFIHRPAGEIATAELRRLKQGAPSIMRCTETLKNSAPGSVSVFSNEKSRIMRTCRYMRRSNNTGGKSIEQPLQGNNDANGEAFWPARKMWRSDEGKRGGGRT